MLSEQVPILKPYILSIFWDYENVAFNSANLAQFLNNIPSVERNIRKNNQSSQNSECISIKRVFADWSKISQETQKTIRSAGFDLIQIPNTGKNSSDNGLMRNALEIVKLTNPSAFLLISVDGDYIELLNELKKAGISTTIIGRERSFSKELKDLVNRYYIVENDGKIFEYTKITQESAIQIIENALSDAYTALKNLEKATKEENQCIFQFLEWRDAFAALENFKNPNLALFQILGIEDLFKFMAYRFGLPISTNFEWICSKPLFTEMTLEEILQKKPEFDFHESRDVISSLLPLDEKETQKLFKELACPPLNKELSNTSREINQNDLSKSQLNMENKLEVVQKPNNNHDNLSKNEYLASLAVVINQLTSTEKFLKKNKIALSSIDSAFKKAFFNGNAGDMSSHYKKFGYSKFSKAVLDAINVLNEEPTQGKKYVMENTPTQSYVKYI